MSSAINLLVAYNYEITILRRDGDTTGLRLIVSLTDFYKLILVIYEKYSQNKTEKGLEKPFKI